MNYSKYHTNPTVFCMIWGQKIPWLVSFVTANKIYCVYIAPDEEMVRTHAERGGFPVNSIAEITTIIDPTTGE